MPLRSLAFVIVLSASLPLVACLTGPGGFPEAGAFDAGGPACVPKKVQAGCIELPLDGGKSSPGTCVDYTGSAYTAATVEKACTTGSVTSCPTDGRVGGSCVLNCGLPNETVTYDYSGITLAQVEAACKGQSGIYLPPIK